MSENKGLCHPSSIDSLSTSAATEDHVSMGGWAARKALRVVEHVEQGDTHAWLRMETPVNSINSTRLCRSRWTCAFFFLLPYSACDRAAGCRPSSGVPASSQIHRSSWEGLRAAAHCGQVRLDSPPFKTQWDVVFQVVLWYLLIFGRHDDWL